MSPWGGMSQGEGTPGPFGSGGVESRGSFFAINFVFPWPGQEGARSPVSPAGASRALGPCCSENTCLCEKEHTSQGKGRPLSDSARWHSLIRKPGLCAPRGHIDRNNTCHCFPPRAAVRQAPWPQGALLQRAIPSSRRASPGWSEELMKRWFAKAALG